MFKKRCNYCHKLITGEDYMVHLRYPKLDGINEEYYHLQCYEKMNREHTQTIRDVFKRLQGTRWAKSIVKYTMLDNVKLPYIARCTICGTVIRARTYEAFRKKLELHAKKCFKRG